MRVYIPIKQGGRKGTYLSDLPFEVPGTAITLTDLIK